MWLPLLFIVLPILEIALFIEVGGLIGLWPTIGLVILMAVAGSWLLRTQGLQALDEVRGAMNGMRDPTGALAHGALIVLAGLLMITPGFFTDILGLSLLVRPVRSAVIARLGQRLAGTVTVRSSTFHDPSGAGGEVVEGEYSEIRPRPADSLPRH